MAEFSRALAKLGLEPEEEGVYWVAKGFTGLVRPHLALLSSCLARQLVGREQRDLVEHLSHIHFLSSPALSGLLGSCLASTLSPALLPRLWDRLAGGSVKVLVSVLVRSRAEVLSCPCPSSLVAMLGSLGEERQEAALTKGLDSWEMDGCPLLPSPLQPGDSAAQQPPLQHSKMQGRLSAEINL